LAAGLRGFSPLQSIQTSSGTHPAYSKDTGYSFPCNKVAWPWSWPHTSNWRQG